MPTKVQDTDLASSDKTPLQERVRIELIRNVYAQTTVGLFASIFCATILLFGIYSPSHHDLLITWYGFILVIMGMRLLLVNAFLRSKAMTNLARWRNLFILGAALAGLGWGFVASVILPYNNMMELVLTVLILCGMTAGAVSALSAVLSAAIVYLVLVLLPLIVRLLLLNNHTFLLFDGAVFIYLCYLISLSIKSHKAIKNSITLQFENSVLLANLSDAKNQLEATNAQLEYAATHDTLTGLANRITFEMRCEEVLKKAELKQEMFALIYINIDNFKEVNETYSYEVGNQLLKRFAERIQRLLPTQAIASRFSSDEIVTVLECQNDINQVTELAQYIQRSVTLPFEIVNYNIMITVSIGISIFPLDGRNFEVLLRNADKCMHTAKKAGGNRIHFNTDLSSIKPSLNNLFPRSN